MIQNILIVTALQLLFWCVGYTLNRYDGAIFGLLLATVLGVIWHTVCYRNYLRSRRAK